MKITIYRYNGSENHTNSVFMIDGQFRCYGLEDQKQKGKVHGETRIPSGNYEVKLRKEGGFNNRYLKKFGDNFHKGMLQICDVPNFEYILIHIGNDDGDTEGCYLVGSSNNGGENFVAGSKEAYLKIYPEISEAIERGECVEIEFINLLNN